MAYRVTAEPLGAVFIFRDVVIGGRHSADVEISHRGTHLLRTPSDISLTGRDRLAKTAAELDSGDGEGWRSATFAAVEAVVQAERQFDGSADLRFADRASGESAMVIDGLFPAAVTQVIGPNEAGKSTLLRGMALSVASGETIIPGCRPLLVGPVLYVVGEDPAVEYHAKNIEEIALGAGIDRSKIAHPIIFYPTRGRSLRQLVRDLSERAQDSAAVLIDSVQSMLGSSDGDIRDRDGDYGNAVDEIGRPSFAAGHPNRADRKAWSKADGSLAGSDVGQDRARCRWKVLYQDDEEGTLVSSTRRYTLECKKWSHGPRFAPISFAIERRFEHPGGWRFTFVTSEPVVVHDELKAGRPSSVYADTLLAYRAGARTPTALAKALGIDYDTARKRLSRYADQFGAEEAT